MSTMYPQNLMNSFVYRHTYNAESPLYSLCGREEQTSHHVICVCNDKREEIKQVMCDLIGEEEVQKADCTTLLNCSRDRRFIQLCLGVLQDGDFRSEVRHNSVVSLRGTKLTREDTREAKKVSPDGVVNIK